MFLDSNVILYLTDGPGAKRARSLELIDRHGIVSVQVLNEVASVLSRKHGLDWGEVSAFTSAVCAKCSVVPLTQATHERGLQYAARHQLNLYDAMIVASAVLAGCTTLYSEDMHNGLVIDGLTIRNPYLAAR